MGQPNSTFGFRSPLLGLIALLSGSSCLIYELVWSRYLHLIFGVSVYAVATVVACFMIGLAIGSWDLGRRLDRSARPARLLAAMQLGIAIYIAASPLLYSLLTIVSPRIFRSIPEITILHHAIRFILAMLALIVPTYLIGGTFPAVLKLAIFRTERAGSVVGWIYAINTLGGAIGTLACGFALIRTVGLSGSLAVAATASAIGGALIFALPPGDPIPRSPEKRTPAKRANLSLLVVFAISGFTSLAYEVFWTRLLSFFFRDSIYDLTIVLTTFLCGIVIGSILCGRLLRGSIDAGRALAVVEAMIACSAIAGLFLVDQFPYWINYLQTNTALIDQYGQRFFLAGNLIRFGYAFGLMLIPTCLFGATFPLIGRLVADELEHVGGRIGLFTAVNTIGSALGALLAGFVFISLLGVQNSIVATAFLNLLAAAMLVAGMRIRRAWTIILSAVAAAVLMSGFLPSWDKLRMSTSFLDQNQPLEKMLSLEFYHEDAHGLTSVVELRPLARKYLITNRLFGQNTSEMAGLSDHRRMGLIPAMLHPAPTSTLAVGLGAGITLRGIAADPRIERIDCVELAPGVIQAARYFAEENRHVLDDPRVHIIASDGRNYVSTSPRQYDLIVLDIFHPMSSGSSTVFSREYYQLCRQRLAPGGIICQWLPVHQLSMPEIQSIVATFASIFPHTSLWFGMIGDSVASVGCIGSDSELAMDPAMIAQRMRDPALQKDLSDVALDTPALLLGNFIMSGQDVTRFCAGASIDTDDRPVIEFAAPKLAMQNARQGMLNQIELAGLMHAPPARSDNPDFQAALRQSINAKKAIFDSFKFLLNGNPDAQIRALQESLARDPTSEDLTLAVKQATQEP
jgi:spermidine synthase